MMGRSDVRKCNVSPLILVLAALALAAVGVVSVAGGRLIGDVGRIGNFVMAGVFILVGFYLLDVIRLSWAAPSGTKVRLGGLPGAVILGLLFATALGPRTFAYLPFNRPKEIR